MDMYNFDATRLTFGAKRDKYVSTHVDAGFPRLVLGTDEAPLRAPFGISTPFSGDAESDRLTFDLEIDEDLCTALTAIDNQVVAAAIDKSQEWFGKPAAKMVRVIAFCAFGGGLALFGGLSFLAAGFTPEPCNHRPLELIARCT